MTDGADSFIPEVWAREHLEALRDNRLAHVFGPPPGPPLKVTRRMRARWRVAAARERLGEIIAGRRFDEWA